MSVQQVLADIREHPERSFWLAFVRGTGKKQGSVKMVTKALYGAPKNQTGGQVTENKETKKRALHVDKGTLPVTDYETQQYLTPLISHIIGYNLKKVIH